MVLSNKVRKATEGIKRDSERQREVKENPVTNVIKPFTAVSYDFS